MHNLRTLTQALTGRRAAGGLLALVALLLVAATTLTTLTLPRHVISGGGGHVVSGATTLDASIGQAVAGVSLSGAAELCAGFWCGAGAVRRPVYLPLLLR
jgi:hypothetical protein